MVNSNHLLRLCLGMMVMAVPPIVAADDPEKCVSFAPAVRSYEFQSKRKKLEFLAELSQEMKQLKKEIRQLPCSSAQADVAQSGCCGRWCGKRSARRVACLDERKILEQRLANAERLHSTLLT